MKDLSYEEKFNLARERFLESSKLSDEDKEAALELCKNYRYT
jgi:hypothetical protein